MSKPSLQLRAVLAGLGADQALLAEFEQLGQPLTVAPGTTLVRAGDHPTQFYVLLTGLIRYFYLDPSGKQWNKAFFCEGQLIGSLSSILLQQPCRYSIETVEACQLVAFPVSLLSEPERHSPTLTQLFDGVLRQIMLRNEDREAMLLTCNHEQRYRWLQQREPWLIERVAQYQLASYLSMEPVSLSRIKRRLEAN